MHKLPELTQRAREWEFAVYEDGPYAAEFRQTEMLTGKIVKRERFSGETAVHKAERRFMEVVLPIVHDYSF